VITIPTASSANQSTLNPIIGGMFSNFISPPLNKRLDVVDFNTISSPPIPEIDTNKPPVKDKKPTSLFGPGPSLSGNPFQKLSPPKSTSLSFPPTILNNKLT
jgi:hypothetical protein